MYNKSKNLQAMQSKQMITDALFSLMKVNSYEDITITQICLEAKVVRRTFYRNFKLKIDIFKYYLDDMLQKFVFENNDSEMDKYKKLKSFFDYLIPYKDFLTILEKNNLFFLINKTITVVINTAGFSRVQDIYVSDFVASTISSILSIWIKNDFKESSIELADKAKIFFKGI